MDVFKEQICAVVGSRHVIVDHEALQEYAAGNIGFIPERFPLLAARPGTVEELQAILHIANRNQIPVTPFSSSTNGHGASIPSVPGITIDLRRLNKIHLIDEMCRNAIIEPGVTFAQLQEKAQEKGLRVLCPVDLPAASSVLSTYVEMTPLFAWPKYGTETVLTMEVVIPNGDLVKTGMAAIPVAETPYFPFGTIPSYFNKLWFAAQGTLGIVTKAVVKLKSLAPANQVLFIPFNLFEESFTVIRELKRLDSPVELFLADSTYLAGLLAEDADAFEGLKNNLPHVTAVLVLRGEDGQVAYQRADIEDLCHTYRREVVDSLPGDHNAPAALLDELSLPRGYARFREMKGAYQVIPFITMIEKIPFYNQIVSRICSSFGHDMQTMGKMLLPVEPSRVHYQYSFYTDPGNQEEYARVKTLFANISSSLIKMGAFFSRPYGEWAGLVYEKASAYKTMLRTIKREVDPGNIMNPGKLNL